MTWSASRRTPSVSPREAKNWKVPTRMWLEATRVSTAPGSAVSRITISPVTTAASDRVVGIPSAAIASLTMYSRSTAVAPARERGRARAFQLDVAADAVGVDNLAEQDGAAIAQLRDEMAEL